MTRPARGRYIAALADAELRCGRHYRAAALGQSARDARCLPGRLLFAIRLNLKERCRGIRPLWFPRARSRRAVRR